MEGAAGPVRQMAFVGLGAVMTAVEEVGLVCRAVAEEGEKLARREQTDVERALVTLTERTLELGDRLQVAVEETVSDGLRHFGVPTRQEVRKLALRLEQLTAKLETYGLER